MITQKNYLLNVRQNHQKKNKQSYFNINSLCMLRQLLTKNFYYLADTQMQRDSRKPKNFPQFTHFASIPFIRQEYRKTLGFVQDKIEDIFYQNKLKHTLKRANTDLMHVTLSMLTLNLQEYRQKTVEVIKSIQKQITQHLKGVTFTLGEIKYFTRYDRRDKREYVNLFYFELVEDENIRKLQKVTDLFIREMIKAQVIESSQLKSMHISYDHRRGMYCNETYHMTLFRVQSLNHDNNFREVFKQVQQIKNQKQTKLVLYCDFVDISTRGHFDGTNFYLPLVRVLLGESKQQTKD